VTLLPPLKRIRSLKLFKLSDLAPQKQPPIAANIVPVPVTPSDILAQIGAQLRQGRESQGLSLDDISTRTQIQQRLIQAIEEGHIEILPESVYVKGMVKRYGDHLGLDGAGIAQNVPSWQSEVVEFSQPSRLTTTFIAPQIKPFHVYLGYTLLLVGSGAGISHLLNDAAKPKPAIILQSTSANGRKQIPAIAPALVAPTPVIQPQSVSNLDLKR
jgi:hypothetical protein